MTKLSQFFSVIKKIQSMSEKINPETSYIKLKHSSRYHIYIYTLYSIFGKPI